MRVSDFQIFAKIGHGSAEPQKFRFGRALIYSVKRLVCSNNFLWQFCRRRSNLTLISNENDLTFAGEWSGHIAKQPR